MSAWRRATGDMKVEDGYYWLVESRDGGFSPAESVEIEALGVYFFETLSRIPFDELLQPAFLWGPLEPPPGPDEPVKNHISTGTEGEPQPTCQHVPGFTKDLGTGERECKLCDGMFPESAFVGGPPLEDA